MPAPPTREHLSARAPQSLEAVMHRRGVCWFPALALLFHLTVAGRFRASELAAVESQAAHGAAPNVRLLARASIAA